MLMHQLIRDYGWQTLKSMFLDGCRGGMSDYATETGRVEPAARKN